MRPGEASRLQSWTRCWQSSHGERTGTPLHSTADESPGPYGGCGGKPPTPPAAQREKAARPQEPPLQREREPQREDEQSSG